MKSDTRRKVRFVVSLTFAILNGLAAAFCIVGCVGFLQDGDDMASFAFVCALYTIWATVIWCFELHRTRLGKHYVILSGIMMAFWALIFMLGFVYIVLDIPGASGFFFVLAFLTLGIILAAWFGFAKYPDRKQLMQERGWGIPDLGNLPFQPNHAAGYNSMRNPVRQSPAVGQRTNVGPGAYPGAPMQAGGMPMYGSFLPEMVNVGTVHWDAASADIPVFAEPGIDPTYIKQCAEHLAGLNHAKLHELAQRIYSDMHVAEYERMIGTREISQDPLSLIYLSCPDRMNIFRPAGPEPAYTVGGEPIFQHDFGIAWRIRGNTILQVGYRNEVEYLSPWG